MRAYWSRSDGRNESIANLTLPRKPHKPAGQDAPTGVLLGRESGASGLDSLFLRGSPQSCPGASWETWMARMAKTAWASLRHAASDLGLAMRHRRACGIASCAWGAGSRGLPPLSPAGARHRPSGLMWGLISPRGVTLSGGVTRAPGLVPWPRDGLVKYHIGEPPNYGGTTWTAEKTRVVGAQPYGLDRGLANPPIYTPFARYTVGSLSPMPDGGACRARWHCMYPWPSPHASLDVAFQSAT